MKWRLIALTSLACSRLSDSGENYLGALKQATTNQKRCQDKCSDESSVWMSMEFLSFLRHDFAGKPVVALGNVSCFLGARLQQASASMLRSLIQHTY